MFIYDVLKMDHRMAMDIIDTIEMVPDGGRRKDMLKLLRVELAMHAMSEEEALYEPLRKRIGERRPGGGAPTGKALIDTAEDEHHQVERLPSEFLQEVMGRRHFLKSYRVKKALAFHPHTPRTEGFRLLRELYREDVSPHVKYEDLICAVDLVDYSDPSSPFVVYKKGSYNPYNRWNTTDGIMHLTQPSNSLSAEILLGSVLATLTSEKTKQAYRPPSRIFAPGSPSGTNRFRNRCSKAGGAPCWPVGWRSRR